MTKTVEGMERLRPITLDDLKNATGDTYFVCAAQRTADGRFCRVRVNGKPKTWKTRPLEVSVPWKHGLYTFGYLTQHDLTTGEWFIEKPLDKQYLTKQQEIWNEAHEKENPPYGGGAQ